MMMIMIIIILEHMQENRGRNGQKKNTGMNMCQNQLKQVKEAR